MKNLAIAGFVLGAFGVGLMSPHFGGHSDAAVQQPSSECDSLYREIDSLRARISEMESRKPSKPIEVKPTYKEQKEKAVKSGLPFCVWCGFENETVEESLNGCIHYRATPAECQDWQVKTNHLYVYRHRPTAESPTWLAELAVIPARDASRAVVEDSYGSGGGGLLRAMRDHRSSRNRAANDEWSSMESGWSDSQQSGYSGGCGSGRRIFGRLRGG